MGVKSVAIIGTAGRDKTKVYDIDLWCAMVKDAQRRFESKTELVSGGAPWADHLAVTLFWSEPEKFTLRLYLPSHYCSKTHRFIGPVKSAASVENYYHERFMQATGIDSRREISHVMGMPGVTVACEPSTPGYGGMFARNKKIALASEACLAYTWGSGREPTDGGTKDTWSQINGRKVHVPLQKLLVKQLNP